MQVEQFNKIVDGTLGHCRDVLIVKAKEYATDDRLHNFKKAANLEDTTPEKACVGMMAKYIVSVYDMVGSGESYPDAVWDEKIGDSINYLLLLRALVEDGKK